MDTDNRDLFGNVIEEREERVSSKHDQEQLFKHDDIVPTSGKTIESLEYSRERIQEVMRRFGNELPQSVMKADKKSRGADTDLAAGSYTATEKYSGAFAKSSSGCAYG